LAYSSRGSIYKEQGKYKLALLDYNKAVQTAPNNLLVYRIRGLFYLYRKKYDLAIQDFSKAIEIKPMSLLYYNRGITYKEKGDYENAIKDFSKTLQRNSRFSLAYFHRGKILLLLKKYKSGINDLRMYLQFNYDAPRAKEARALIEKYDDK